MKVIIGDNSWDLNDKFKNTLTQILNLMEFASLSEHAHKRFERSKG